MEQENRKPRCREEKRLSTPLLIFIILMAVTAVLCTIVAGIWLHGRSSLRNRLGPPVTPGGTEQLDSYTVLHDGKYYRYKEHMVNLLLIGVDSDNKPRPLPYGSDNQADVILVAALDTDANRMTLISVSRDTMCDIGGVPDDTGEISGAAHTQLAPVLLQRTFCLYESCRLCQGGGVPAVLRLAVRRLRRLLHGRHRAAQRRRGRRHRQRAGRLSFTNVPGAGICTPAERDP